MRWGTPSPANGLDEVWTLEVDMRFARIFGASNLSQNLTASNVVPHLYAYAPWLQVTTGSELLSAPLRGICNICLIRDQLLRQFASRLIPLAPHRHTDATIGRFAREIPASLTFPFRA
jgi:hypothetical protein